MLTLPRSVLCIAAAVLTLALAGANAQAACGTALDRPSVGLVLSGGGARGAAHIGVIRVLEELQIPVDCVAGTSMGAVIGGLYAAGHNADELEQIALGIDWPDAFRDDPSRRDLSFRRRQDDYDYLIALDLGFRDGRVRLPRGLVQGQKLGLLLRGFTAPVSSVRNFDELPTPFRAVATDAEDGRMVVLDSGDLAEAMHASMAAPGIFAPVEIDGRILIDGGISSNLPINVARAMGADIIIAVDIGFPLLPRADLDSAIALSEQALTILIRRESDKELQTLTGRDVAILPELGLIGSADFDKIDSIITLGAAAARDAHTALGQLALDETGYADYLAARERLRIRDERRLASVTIRDDSRIAQRVLASRLLTRAGEPLDIRKLEQDLTRLYGLDIYESVDYEIVGDPPNLVINARQKSWGPNFLNFGLNLAVDFDGASSYNVGLRFTRTQINSLGAEWRTDLQFGDNPRLFSEFFQPLGYASRFFVAPQFEVQEFDSEAFDDFGNAFAEFRVSQARLGTDVGYFFNNRSELRLGTSYATGRAVPQIGDPGLERIDFDTGNIRLDYRYDNLDSVRFPRSGARGLLSVESRREFLGADQRLDRIQLDWSGVYSPSEFSFVGRVSAKTNLGGNGQVADLFELGGLFNLSGYRTGQLRDQHAFLTSLTVYRRIALGENFNLPLYIGGSVETGNVWSDSSDIDIDNLRYGGSAFIGLDTPIGPLLLGYGIAEGGNTAAYFFLGPTFGSR